MKNLIIISFILVLFGCNVTHTLPKSCSNMETCINLVKLKLQSNLTVEEAWKGSSITIEFSLDNQGNVIEHKISSTSGLAELEQAGMKSIYDSSPFTELLSLPTNVYEEFKQIKLTIYPFG